MWRSFFVKELNFKVHSQYPWEVVAQSRVNFGLIELKVTARAELSTKVCTRQCEKLASKKKALVKRRTKVVAGSDTDSDANVSTLALNTPAADEFSFTVTTAPMEVHRRTCLCLNLFGPPYVFGQCHKTLYLWCMHREGYGFCVYSLEFPVRGRAYPNTDKWLFQKWCQEVDVEEVFTTTSATNPCPVTKSWTSFLILFWPLA